MNIAIPIHGNRVMPRFGCTREIMIVTVEDGKILSRKRLTMTQEKFTSLPEVFASERIAVMICGGIHPRFQQAIQEQNIQLIWGVIGEWQDVLQAHLNGTLQSDPAFCSRHGRRRGSRFRGGQQWIWPFFSYGMIDTMGNSSYFLLTEQSYCLLGASYEECFICKIILRKNHEHYFCNTTADWTTAKWELRKRFE